MIIARRFNGGKGKISGASPRRGRPSYRKVEDSMSIITRRTSLGIIGAATAAGWLSANADDSPKAPHKWPQVEPRDAIRERYFPNVILTTHEGKSVRLYDDLIKDKV